MAFSAGVVWEVRTTGSDSNGGGFLAGATGTDYSQQTSPQVSYTDLVIDGTTNTKCTSAGNPFTSAHVGNIINITGGTGFTVQRVQVISVAAGAATCDKSLGTLSSTGGTGNLGGCLATLSAAAGVYVASNKIFVKATATYTPTATTTFATGAVAATTVPYTRVIGYTTTRGDGIPPTIQATTNTGISVLKSTGQGISFENFIIDCNSLGTSIGVEATAAYSRIRSVKVSNFTSAGIKNLSTAGIVEDCEITAGTSAATAGINVNSAGPVTITRCYIHDNACPGIVAGSGYTILFNIIDTNTGASSDGIQFTFNNLIQNNTIYGNGRHGLSGTSTTGGLEATIKNNILESNGGWGLQLASAAGWCADPAWDGNAYYNNTSGTRNRADDTSTNPQNNVGAYTNVLDKILSSSAFTNGASGDFSLNNTAGGGASCRAAASPGAFLGNSTVGYLDMGAVQHQDTGGGGPVGGSMIVGQSVRRSSSF